MSKSEAEQDRTDSFKSTLLNSQGVKLKLLKGQKHEVRQQHEPFHKLKRNATNLFNENLYSDDHFKLEEIKSIPKTNRKISICRLKDIIPPGTLLFGEEINTNLSKLSGIALPHFPSFICEMHVLPFWHYQTLIQPKYVNEKGFYHVVIWKDGRLVKETIDDTFYYDETFKTIYTDFSGFKCYIWMHILLKVWVKCKGSYNKLSSAQPFQFIKTFSYPDWKVVNPALQDIQKLVSKMNNVQKKQIVAVAQTKNDPNVGLFGLIPNSAGYLLTGHYMEFEAVFIKVKSLNGSKWNGFKSLENSLEPEDQIFLQQSEFIMPVKEFNNLFHLIHLTSNKFDARQDIFYTRYSLNLDARQSKAKTILIEVNNPSSATQSTMEKQPKEMHYMVNLTIYFPDVRAYDLSRQKIEYQHNQSFKIPFCKLMIGRQEETTNLEASFVESMKEMMLENQDEDFLYGMSTMQYEWIEGTYFKGYDHNCTFLMKLKAGRYILRFKMETLRVEYRANINVVSSTHVKISDPKMDKKQQQEFLKEMLSSKARFQKRNIGYLNPIKKGSWYICNDDFNSIGYGYLVIQTIKTSEYKVELRVDPQALKDCGYRLKDKRDQNKFMLTLKQDEGYTLILKIQDGWQDAKNRIWPPEGISITRLLKN